MSRNRYPLAARIILRHVSRAGTLCASYDALAAATGYDRDTIRVSMRSLVASGKITRRTGHGRIPNEYVVAEE